MPPFTFFNKTVLLVGGLGLIAECLLKTFSTADAKLAVTDRHTDVAIALGTRNFPPTIAGAFLFLCPHFADEIDGYILRVDAGVGLPKLG